MLVWPLAPEELRPLYRIEYEQLVNSGAFEGERVELLEGLVFRKSPHGPLHDGILQILTELLTLKLGSNASVRVQSAFVAGDRSEPEPDLAVVPRADYRAQHPRIAHLLVEVADTSLERDRTTKRRIYAQSGVPEYWIVNLAERCIDVYREPVNDDYGEPHRCQLGDEVSLTQFPDVRVLVRGLFG